MFVAESQRDSAIEPRVARHELPWEIAVERISTPKGLWLEAERERRNPVGVETSVGPRSQGRRNAPTLGFVTESRWDLWMPAPGL